MSLEQARQMRDAAFRDLERRSTDRDLEGRSTDAWRGVKRLGGDSSEDPDNDPDDDPDEDRLDLDNLAEAQRRREAALRECAMSAATMRGAPARMPRPK